jgi:phosphopantetheinyl transferase
MTISVELWRGRCLDVELRCWRLPAEVTANERDLLSDEERERAAGFKAERRRVEYVASRAYLRSVLGEVLGTIPSSIPISPDDSGKPQHAGGMQFNLSHSASAVLVGWGARALGVDLEASQRRTQHISRMRIVAQVCEAASVDAIGAFTLVEAASKAIGRGLSAVRGLRLDGVVGAGDIRLLSGAQRIRACRIALPDGYTGAVAVLD